MNEEDKDEDDMSVDLAERNEPVFKEMSYSVHSSNLEATLKLLMQSKSICLIDKKDPKSKRMFITA